MNDEERKYVASLEALHAGKLELARGPENFAREIMGFADDVLADMNVDGKTEFGGESASAIVNRILAQRAGEYLSGVKAPDTPKEAPEPELNDSVKAFRARMAGGKNE